VTRASARFAIVVLLVASLVALASARDGKTARETKPAQSTSPSFFPNSIAFWDSEHGLVGGVARRSTGKGRSRAYGVVLATSDGGKTFATVLRVAGEITSVATAGKRDAWAVVSYCNLEACPVPFELLHSGDRGESRNKLPGPAIDSVSFATASRGMAVTHSGQLLTTGDGGRSWSVVQRWPG